MASRVVLVQPGSKVLEHESTQRLSEYPSGEVLVRTEAPADGGREAPAPSGLALAHANGDEVSAARETPLPESAGLEVLAYVEFAGPTDGAWLEELQRAGVEPIQFQPVSSYLCRGSGPAFDAVRELPFVLSVTPLDPALKPSVNVPE